MICPYCNSFTPDGSRFCCRCASRIPEAVTPDAPAAVAEDIPVPAPAKKKGRLWPPLLILAILFAFGLGLFLHISKTSAPQDPAMPWFSVQNGTLYFDEGLYTGGSELTVPAVVAGQSVTAIGDECFYNCTRLTAVRLPDGIESIGTRAFSGCISLRGILLPDTLTAIGTEAFAGCVSLEAICIPASVDRVGADVFADCGKLVHVFYSGLFASLDALGIEFENPQVCLYCADGPYRPE